jgi:hypothetical protein
LAEATRETDENYGESLNEQANWQGIGVEADVTVPAAHALVKAYALARRADHVDLVAAARIATPIDSNCRPRRETLCP